MKFERTEDQELIKSVLTLPVIYENFHDDFAPSVHEWEIEIHPCLGYVAITDNGEFLGLSVVAKHSKVMWEIHNAILPHVGWKRRLKIGRAFLNWAWQCGCKRVIGKVPAYNKYAIRFNEIVGMECFGVNKKSFMKHGILQDEFWFGISAPEGE